MHNLTRTARWIVPFVVLTMSGCFSLGRDAPPVEHYVLGRVLLAEPAPQPDAAGLDIGVRRIDLAPYLAAPLIVVRHGTHQIVTSDFHRWAEAPGVAINRAVARYLAASGGIRAVDVAPWPVRTPHDYLIQLHVTRFEGVAPEAAAADAAGAPAGEAHMQAAWEIIRPLDGAVLARGVTDYRQPGWTVGDHAALVTLLDRGLVELARELAARLPMLAGS
jgi:uncharacterized lipoprotein YmbA